MAITALPDVNVLFALAWPSHAHHDTAWDWFLERREDGWATCPLTEAGFVRLSCNRSIVGHIASPREAIERLAEITSLGAHSFWPLSVSMLDVPGQIVARLQGRRQITDAVLLSAVMRHDGQLVTLDRRLPELASGELQRFLRVLPD